MLKDRTDIRFCSDGEAVLIEYNLGGDVEESIVLEASDVHRFVREYLKQRGVYAMVLSALVAQEQEDDSPEALSELIHDLMRID